MVARTPPLSGDATLRSDMRSPLRSALAAAALAAGAIAAGAGDLHGHDAPESTLDREAVLAATPPQQRPAMAWLLERMPAADRDRVDAAFLLEHCDLAHAAWSGAPWHALVPEAIFLDAILPYASVSETRERWRTPLRERTLPRIEGLACPAEAAARINATLFGDLGVRYSTQRRRADASPSESIESGLASCTGLSILLVNACRSVGIPARLVGTPLWRDGSGNHSWVEIWDGSRWRFTGAAEPTGDRLDEAWFTGRAAAAVEGDPRHGIYAVTWTDAPQRFPIAFTDEPSPSRAIEVTARYRGDAPAGDAASATVRVVARAGPRRVALPVAIHRRDGTRLAAGRTRDDRADGNDHFEATLPAGTAGEVRIAGRRTPFEATDQALVEIDLADDPASAAVGELVEHLAREGLAGIAEARWAATPLSSEDAAAARAILVEAFLEERRRERAATFEARVLERGGLRMPIWFTTRGEASPKGRSVYISMHGGGQAPPELHERQWLNQQRLYAPEEGIYLAPRAPTDTWNLWHQAHIDDFFDDLIADLVAFEGADPDRVYLMGYSAGGDGVYQLAPRMADRFAAAAMMAGHPNDASPEGLRNLPFALQVGAEDSGHNRNGAARAWERRLGELAASDPGGYPHWVKLHEGKAHWMDREDVEAVPWMASHRRQLRPARVVWRQHGRTHRRFYWLAVSEPRPGARIAASRQGQRIELESWDRQGELRIRLDDEMLDLDGPVEVVEGERTLFSGRVPRTIATLLRTLGERGDPRGVFSGEIVLPHAAGTTPPR